MECTFRSPMWSQSVAGIGQRLPYSSRKTHRPPSRRKTAFRRRSQSTGSVDLRVDPAQGLGRPIQGRLQFLDQVRAEA